MIYLFDFLFITGFLVIRDLAVWILDFEYDIFCRIRKSYMWFEFAYVVAGVLYMPRHSTTEAAVAFFLCLVTKGFHDFFKNNSKIFYERDFETRKK